MQEHEEMITILDTILGHHVRSMLFTSGSVGFVEIRTQPTDTPMLKPNITIPNTKPDA